MKINSFNSPLFQKKLVASCAVVKNNRPLPCEVYELDKKDDRLYFDNLMKKPSWEDSFFLKSVSSELQHSQIPFKFYVLETKRGKCLAYSQVSVRFNKFDNLEYIETMPSCKAKNPKRNIKYAGESLITTLVGLCANKNGEKFKVLFPLDAVREFYVENCGFSTKKLSKEIYLNTNQSENLHKINEEHTKTKIEYHI